MRPYYLANRNWDCRSKDKPETAESWEAAIVTVLMDVRAELQRLNSLLHCSNFTEIPFTLRAIKRQTERPARRKAKAKK